MNIQQKIIQRKKECSFFTQELKEHRINYIYQPKLSFYPDDMGLNEVYGCLATAISDFPDVGEDNWLTIDCSDICPVVEPKFIG